MKKIIALLLATIMLLAFAGCENDPDTTKPVIPQTQPSEPSSPTVTDPAGPSDTPTEPSAPTDPTEPVHYDPNLPDDIVLSLEGKSASVVNKRAKAIFEEMGLKYTTQTQYKEENYKNGIPYTVFYKGDDQEGWTFATLTEWFDAGHESVHLHAVSVQFNAFGSPEEMSLLGINKNASKEETFSILGSPHSEIVEGKKGYTLYTYYWRDIYIGETFVDCVTVEFSDDVAIYVNIAFTS